MGDGIGAWTGRWVVGNTLPDKRHLPRFYLEYLEYARASGDGTAKDGRHGAFDPLFPSSHDKYGLTDLFGSTNISYLRPGFQYRLRASLTLGVAYNNLSLANPHDGLYMGSKIVARNPNGVLDTHIGQEADVQAQWTVSRATQFTVGYGRLFPGEFLERATSGVPYNIVFLNMAQRF